MSLFPLPVKHGTADDLACGYSQRLGDCFTMTTYVSEDPESPVSLCVGSVPIITSSRRSMEITLKHLLSGLSK